MIDKKYNPYPGPRPFEQNDQKCFFGREREIRQLMSLVIAHRAVLLYAQSGAGKSSLLNAGVIPLLEEENFQVLPVVRVRGFELEDIDSKEIPNIYVFNTLMGWAEGREKSGSLVSMSVAAFLKEYPQLTDEEGVPLPRIIMFDQFEELFTAYPHRWKEREEFFRQMAEAFKTDPMLRVLFVIREDYLANLDPYVNFLPEQMRTHYRLERLRQEAACKAVENPLKNTGCLFAEGVALTLVQQLLTIRSEGAAGETIETMGEYIEPVQLQVVCQNLWLNLPSDVTVITTEHLQSFGDVGKALTNFYERIIEIASSMEVDEKDIRYWFNNELITPAGTRGTVFRGQEYTGKIPNTVVDILEDQHIIRAELRAGSHWYELTHDRLIEPIRKANNVWLQRQQEEKQRQSLETERQRAEEQALNAKHFRKRARVLLLILPIIIGVGIYIFCQEQKAEKAKVVAVNAKIVAEQERQYAKKQANIARQQRIKAEKAKVMAEQERQHAKEQADIAKQHQIEAEEAKVVAEQERQHAKKQAIIAFAQKLMIQAESIRNQRPDQLPLSVLLAMEAIMRLPSSGLKTELAPTLCKGLSLLPTPVAQAAHGNFVNAISFSSNGKYLATSSRDNTARVWQVDNGKEVLRVNHNGVSVIAFSPDGKLIATGGKDNTIRVWNAVTGQEVNSMTHNGDIIAVAFSPNRNYLASASQDNTARIWDVATGQKIAMMSHQDGVSIIAFSPDGKYIATGSQDNTIRVWNANSGKEISVMRHKSDITALAFSSDKTNLITSSLDKTARVWETDTGKQVACLIHDHDVTSVAFSPDRKYIATSSWDKHARVWEIDNSREVIRVSHQDKISTIAFSPNGKYIATGSWDNTARVWEVAGGQEITRIAHENDVSNVAFSPDGEYLATVSWNQIRIWKFNTDMANIAQLDPDRLIKKAAERLTRNLTHKEWQQYLPDEPYRKTCKNLPQEQQFSF